MAQQKTGSKFTRKVIGSVCKGALREDGTKASDYIKVFGDHVLKNGQFLNLETPDEQLKNAEEAMRAGKITEELVNKIRARVEKMPKYVRFEIIAKEPKN